jgi:hypothetical protein
MHKWNFLALPHTVRQFQGFWDLSKLKDPVHTHTHTHTHTHINGACCPEVWSGGSDLGQGASPGEPHLPVGFTGQP